VGFQEIVGLNASSVLMGNNSSQVKQWNDLVLQNLNKAASIISKENEKKDKTSNSTSLGSF
jgi:hypothetical protein